MFVGSVGWLLSLLNTIDECRVTIFDCTREDVIWDSNECNDSDIAQEVSFQGLDEYDVCSCDLWVDGSGKVHLEINIEMDEEEEE